MERIVQPELLDELPADDRKAIQSRRDLRRINAWMGNAGSTARALREAFPELPPGRIVEMGAGDGAFLLSVARQLAAPRRARPPQLAVPPSAGRAAGLSSRLQSVPVNGHSTSVVLVDRQALLRAETLQRFESLNWKVRAVTADVFDFYKNGAEAADVVIVNLFLHHFADDQVRRLLQLAGKKTRVLIAVEPRRSRLALLASRFVWLIGCNAVTRHDAVASVRAGFSRRELSNLWPAGREWETSERSAGLFSHLFMARRVS